MRSKVTMMEVMKRMVYDWFKREVPAEGLEIKRHHEQHWKEHVQELKDAAAEVKDGEVVVSDYLRVEIVRKRRFVVVKKGMSWQWWVGLFLYITGLSRLSRWFRRSVVRAGCKRPYGWHDLLYNWIEDRLYNAPYGSIRCRLWYAFFSVSYHRCPWCFWHDYMYLEDEPCIDVVEERESHGVEETTYYWSGWKTCPKCGYYEYLFDEEY